MSVIKEAVVFSTDQKVTKRLALGMEPAVRHIHQENTVQGLLDRAQKGAPHAVLIHLTGEHEDGISLARQLRRTDPELAILGFGREKDPDLILSGMRAGISDFLALESDDAQLSAAIFRSLERIFGDHGSGDLIAVYSLKGGQGVTTVAVNLADQIQSLTHGKVVLADLNLYRGDAADHLNLVCAFTPYQLVDDLQRMDQDLLFSSLVQYKQRFHLLGTGAAISDADRIGPADLAAMMTLLRQHFDTVVVDLPSDCSEKNRAVMAAADRILLVVQQTVPEVKNLQSVVEFCREISLNDSRLEILINRYSKTNDLTINTIENLVGCPVTGVIASDYKAVTRAAHQGSTLMADCPGKKITRDFRALATRLAGLPPANGHNWRKALTEWMKG